jgi:ABC-type dipeptide/oligopeptide/nickel transport system ATPase component
MLLLKVENLLVEESKARSDQAVPILENINIQIKKNKITSLIGESGAGKTIFGKTLAALLPAHIAMTKGTIFYEDQPVTYDRLKKMRGSHIFYTPQNAPASLNPVTKIKNQINETSKIEPNQLIKLLKDLNLHDPDRILNSYPFELSGGENQRCLLAMAVAQKPRVLILDEPTASLDQPWQEGFMQLIKTIQQQYCLTILLITHNLSLAKNISDFIYIILKGKIIEEGPPQELFSNPTHDYTKEIVYYFFASGGPAARALPAP